MSRSVACAVCAAFDGPRVDLRAVCLADLRPGVAGWIVGRFLCAKCRGRLGAREEREAG